LAVLGLRTKTSGDIAHRADRRIAGALGEPDLAQRRVALCEVPVWDIADKFGDTSLLVTDMAQASDLAQCLGGHRVALMRGHGFAAAAPSLIEVVRLSVYLPRNARALMRASQLGGEVKYLSQGEIEAHNRGYSPHSAATWRAWEYWANRAGCAHLLTRPGGGDTG